MLMCYVTISKTSVSFAVLIQVQCEWFCHLWPMSGILRILSFFQEQVWMISQYSNSWSSLNYALFAIFFFIGLIWAILPCSTSSGILCFLPFLSWIRYRWFCHISPSLKFCLFCHFSIGPVWFFVILAPVSCILLVLPFSHSSSMGDFSNFKLLWTFASFAIFQ